MKKRKTKILLSLGAIATLVTTGSAILSCGTSVQQKLDAITDADISNYLKEQPGFAPDSSKDVPKIVPSETLIATINGITGLTITISHWTPNQLLGSVTFDANIFKTGLVAKTIPKVTYSGWITEKTRLDDITAEEVANYVKNQLGFVPSSSSSVPASAPSTSFSNVNLNNVFGLTITIKDWTPDQSAGSISFSVDISKNGLPTKTITYVTYSGWMTDQNRLDAFTTNMVKAAITTTLAPSKLKSVPDAPVGNEFSEMTINGLSGLSIVISNWTKDLAQGTVSFSITSIYKGAAEVDGTTFGTISIIGFASTDQIALDSITTEMVQTAITTVLAPVSTKSVPNVPVGSKFTGITINGLSDVSITVTSWAKHNALGSVGFTVTSIEKGILTVSRNYNLIISGFQSTITFTQSGIPPGYFINSTIQTKNGNYYVGTDQGIFRSTNGIDFEQISSIPINKPIYAICQTLDGSIYLGSDGAIWKSIDGITFAQIITKPADWKINSIYQTKNGNIYVGVDNSHGLLVSNDNGATFKSVGGTTTDWSINSIYQTSNGDIYVSTNNWGNNGSGGLWVLKNSGTVFTQVGGGLGSDWNIYTTYQTSNGDIYVGVQNNGLWVSKDSGITFTKVIAGGMGPFWSFHSICQTSYSGNIFVGTGASGLWMSLDNGITFNKVNQFPRNNIQLLYQTPIGGKLFVGTPDFGLYESIDFFSVF